jgi:hypothetical protein
MLDSFEHCAKGGDMGASLTLKVLDNAREGFVFANDDMCGAKPL